MPLIVRHWKGGITTHAIKTAESLMNGWAKIWAANAWAAESRGNTLVIFEIPAAAEKELIAAMEQFLQERPETKQFEPSKRPNGFYWVKPKNNTWTIGEWDGRHWSLNGNEWDFSDDDFEEIDSEPITKNHNKPLFV